METKEQAPTSPRDEHDELPELTRRLRVGQEFGIPAGARRLGALKRFRRLRALYQVQQNPRHALAAYQVARDFGTEIPEWVLEYLDLAAGNVHSEASRIARLIGAAVTKSERKRIKEEIAPAIVRAFGFRPGGVYLQLRQFLFEHGLVAEAPSNREATGAFNPLKADSTRDIAIADHVRIIMHTEKKTLKEAKKAAAEHAHVSMSTVTLALRKYAAAPSPVERVSDDIRICEKAGMSRSEAIRAVAGERGRHEATIKAALRRRSRITKAAPL